MSKFTIEVCPEGFVALQVSSKEVFFNVIRDVIAGHIEGVDCVYLRGETFEYTWYEGIDFEVDFKVDSDYWDQAFECLPAWVTEG